MRRALLVAAAGLALVAAGYVVGSRHPDAPGAPRSPGDPGWQPGTRLDLSESVPGVVPGNPDSVRHERGEWVVERVTEPGKPLKIVHVPGPTPRRSITLTFGERVYHLVPAG